MNKYDKYPEKLIMIKEEIKEEETNTLYQIRPYALEFIRALKSFFSIVIFSKLPLQHIIKITDHIEAILNQPNLE